MSVQGIPLEHPSELPAPLSFAPLALLSVPCSCLFTMFFVVPGTLLVNILMCSVLHVGVGPLENEISPSTSLLLPSLLR